MIDLKSFDEFKIEPLEKKSIWKKAFLIFGGIVGLFVIFFVWHFVSAYGTIVVDNNPWWEGMAAIIDSKNARTVAESPPPPEPVPSPESNRYDILILGIRGGDAKSIALEGGLLTDTMLVLSYNKTTRTASVISIPRDLYVDMGVGLTDGTVLHFKGKINEAYERGLAHHGGLTFASNVVSIVTGVHIDKAMAFDFDAFKNIINELGGVDVRLAKPFKEGTQWGFPFTLPAGQNHLDGDQALYFARSRFESSDFDRAARQQKVILAIKEKATSLGVIANPIKLTSLMDALKGHMQTNVQLWEIGDLIDMAKSLGDGSVRRAVLTTEKELVESQLDSGAFILLSRSPNFAEIKDTFASVFQTSHGSN